MALAHIDIVADKSMVAVLRWKWFSVSQLGHDVRQKLRITSSLQSPFIVLLELAVVDDVKHSDRPSERQRWKKAHEDFCLVQHLP